MFVNYSFDGWFPVAVKINWTRERERERDNISFFCMFSFLYRRWIENERIRIDIRKKKRVMMGRKNTCNLLVRFSRFSFHKSHNFSCISICIHQLNLFFRLIRVFDGISAQVDEWMATSIILLLIFTASVLTVVSFQVLTSFNKVSASYHLSSRRWRIDFFLLICLVKVGSIEYHEHRLMDVIKSTM